MNWHWPQYTYAAMFLIGLLTDAYRHGRPITKTENIFVTIVATAIGATILHFGGFW